MDSDEVDFSRLHPETAEPLSPRAELGAFIAAQDDRTGDVYRLTQRGLDARAIADELDVATTGFVYQYQQRAKAAIDGELPTGVWTLKGTTSTLNTLVKRGRGVLSTEAAALLEAHRDKARAAVRSLDPDQEAQAEAEAEDSEQQQITGSLQGVAGIYAFSYGHYLAHPLQEDNDNFLIKVGRSDDVAQRIEQHRSGARAHIPEPLVTVRVYATLDADLIEVEKTFQRLLRSAGHDNPRRETTRRGSQNEVGAEWYLTNREFLDAIASALKLPTRYSD